MVIIKEPHLKPCLTEDQVKQSRREVDKAYELYKQLSKRRVKKLPINPSRIGEILF